jgi:hypothetical protein
VVRKKLRWALIFTHMSCGIIFRVLSRQLKRSICSLWSLSFRSVSCWTKLLHSVKNALSMVTSRVLSRSSYASLLVIGGGPFVRCFLTSAMVLTLASV